MCWYIYIGLAEGHAEDNFENMSKGKSELYLTFETVNASLHDKTLVAENRFKILLKKEMSKFW